MSLVLDLYMLALFFLYSNMGFSVKATDTLAFVVLAVTTASQAKAALKMLRESKNRFDLVISDVHMPDMDGFKLLELVGLEMDLPVISKK